MGNISFGSLGVNPPPIINQATPDYSQWDWNASEKANRENIESWFNMGSKIAGIMEKDSSEEAQKQAYELQLAQEKELFPLKLAQAQLQREKIKADLELTKSQVDMYKGQYNFQNVVGGVGGFSNGQQLAHLAAVLAEMGIPGLAGSKNDPFKKRTGVDQMEYADIANNANNANNIFDIQSNKKIRLTLN